MKKHNISAFFPIYNDEGTVELMAKKMEEMLKKHANEYEIIIVDDKTPDNAGKIADELAKKNKRIRVIHHEVNKGYGGALKSGLYNSKYELIFYTDGDAQYDVYEMPKLLEYIDKYDVVNGYKTNRADKKYRKIMGEMYNWVMHIMFDLKVKDVDCDFRLFHKYVFDHVNIESNSGLVCVEMMKRTQDNGFTIKNVPVKHYPRLHGQSQFFKPLRILSLMLAMVNQWYELVVSKKLRRMLKW